MSFDTVVCGLCKISTAIVLLRLDANGVKRGHAFGDIGDSLGGRAKLRLVMITMRSMVVMQMRNMILMAMMIVEIIIS